MRQLLGIAEEETGLEATKGAQLKAHKWEGVMEIFCIISVQLYDSEAAYASC